MKEKNSEESFFEAIGSKDILCQLFETMPYPIAFFKPDGKVAYMNPAACENLNIASFSELLDGYNLLHDEYALDIAGLREFSQKVFAGEMARVKDVKMPFNRVSAFTRKDEALDESFRLNITGFPLFNEKKEIAFVMCIAHRTAAYKGKELVIKAKEYINEHWLTEYNAGKIAESVKLSARHLDRLFKQSTGETPFHYYKRIKIDKLKESLVNPNLNVEQAFESCHVDYNGSYAQFFKEAVGMSPLEYKKRFTL